MTASLSHTFWSVRPTKVYVQTTTNEKLCLNSHPPSIRNIKHVLIKVSLEFDLFLASKTKVLHQLNMSDEKKHYKF